MVKTERKVFLSKFFSPSSSEDCIKTRITGRYIRAGNVEISCNEDGKSQRGWEKMRPTKEGQKTRIHKETIVFHYLLLKLTIISTKMENGAIKSGDLFLNPFQLI